MHYEADLDRGGRSVLDIRPLLWKDGWPVGGDNFSRHLRNPVGTQRLRVRAGGGLRTDRHRPSHMGTAQGTVTPVPNQTLEQDSAKWPAGKIAVDLSDYMVPAAPVMDYQPVENVGGYPGAPYFKIIIAGTTVRWRRPRTAKWRRFPRSQALPNNYGALTS